MDIKYINKVVEDIFVEGMSKLEIKTEVYKRLDKELKGEDRMIEYIIGRIEYISKYSNLKFNNLRMMKWNSQII